MIQARLNGCMKERETGLDSQWISNYKQHIKFDALWFYIINVVQL